MGCHKNSCNEKVCLCVKDPCGKKRKVKATIVQNKSSGANKSVTASQSVTPVTTTVLQITNGNFSFGNCKGCRSCCSPCGYNNYNTYNSNTLCLDCKGLYNITAFVTLDVAPNLETVTLAIDINGQQVIAVPLTGGGNAINFATNLNLCGNSRLQFRIYSSSANYVGNVTGGMVSAAKVGAFVC